LSTIEVEFRILYTCKIREGVVESEKNQSSTTTEYLLVGRSTLEPRSSKKEKIKLKATYVGRIGVWLEFWGTHGEGQRWIGAEWGGVWEGVSPFQPTRGSGGAS